MPKRNTKNMFKRGGIWWIKIIRDGKLHRESTKTSSLQDAIIYRDQQLAAFTHKDKAEAAALLQGKIDYHKAAAREIEKKARRNITLAGLWRKWLETAPRASEATLHQYAVQVGALSSWMENSFPESNAEDITPEMARAFVRHLEKKKRSANTINKYIMLFRQIWRDLFKDDENPWLKVERRSGETIGRRPLTSKELSTVLNKADAELRILIMLGALLGLRLGDACTLQWQAVDLASSRITFKPRKTRTRNRSMLVLPLADELQDALRQLSPGKGSDYVLPKLAQDYLRHPTCVTNRLQKLFADCGITTLKARENGGRKAVEVGFHSLRHSLASSLAEANVPHAVAQEILGHASPALLRTYQHVGAKQVQIALSKAAKRMSKAIK